MGTMNDLLTYYPTKGGYVVGKSARYEHPNMEKMPTIDLKKTGFSLPILDPKKTSTKAIQVESRISRKSSIYYC
ncbi:hypothetical protein MKW92_046381 [Papaver armeniacum]|nr:hypothetical protein MKW92_046381 [Papaver armeniacum]